MRNLIFNGLFILGAMFLTVPTYAQDDTKYGEHPEDCKRVFFSKSIAVP